MLPLAAALAVLAVTPASAIQGGTPEQRASVKAILDRLPECLTAPSGVPVAVTITDTNDPTASYEHARNTIVIDASMLDAVRFDAASRPLIEDECATKKQVSWMTDTRRVLVHELAHAYHAAGRAGRRSVSERMESFLDIRFEREYEIWANDPIRGNLETALKALLDKAQALRAAGQEVPSKLLGAICEMHWQLKQIYIPTGLPRRYENDRHAVKEPEIDLATGQPVREGAEYFAIALESMTSAHGLYCSAYEPAEREWLESELGDCVGAIPGRARCAPSNPASHHSDRAGIRR